MKDPLFIRYGHIIKELKPEKANKITRYDSNNKAKKESHRLQIQHDKSLGRGSVIKG